MLSCPCSEQKPITTSKTLLEYVSTGQPSEPQVHAAFLDIRPTYGDYMKAMQHVHKGNAVREARKSDAAGFTFDAFNPGNHTLDIYTINTSKEVRMGMKMFPHYLRTVEEMGGEPKALKPQHVPSCQFHWRLSLGVFNPEPGYMQGDVVVDRRLLSYANLVRTGNIIWYAVFIGHGDYLDLGIMYKMHFGAYKWLKQAGKQWAAGAEYLVYAYMNNDSLSAWKRRVMFHAGLMVYKDGAMV